MTEPALPPLLKRISIAKAAMDGWISKRGRNKHGGYNHATVDDVYDAVRQQLAANFLDVLIQQVSRETFTAPSKAGGETRWIILDYDVGFIGEDPQRRSCMLPLTGPQTFEAAVSYVQKQWLRARFQLPTGEADADSVAPDENAPAPPPQMPKPSWNYDPTTGELTLSPADVNWSQWPDGPRNCNAALYTMLRTLLVSSNAQTVWDVNRDKIASLPASGYQAVEKIAMEHGVAVQTEPGENG